MRAVSSGRPLSRAMKTECRGLLLRRRSLDGAEVVSGVTGELVEVVAQTGVAAWVRSSRLSSSSRRIHRRRGGRYGLRRATGLPLTVMVMSSPAAMRRSRPAVLLRRSLEATSDTDTNVALMAKRDLVEVDGRIEGWRPRYAPAATTIGGGRIGCVAINTAYWISAITVRDGLPKLSSSASHPRRAISMPVWIPHCGVP